MNLHIHECTPVNVSCKTSKKNSPSGQHIHLEMKIEGRPRLLRIKLGNTNKDSRSINEIKQKHTYDSEREIQDRRGQREPLTPEPLTLP